VLPYGNIEGMRSSAAALAFLLLLAIPSYAGCVPKRVLHVVMRIDDPALPADHFARKPRTVYRLGNHYGLVEEAYDPDRKLQLRVVVSEPDVWMANLADHSGQHMIDPGPSIDFHAPVLDAVDSKHWRQMEIGCEVPYMKAVKAAVAPSDDGGKQYTHSAEGTTVVLTVDRNEIPKRVDISGAKGKYSMIYDTYEMLDDASPARFAKPQDVEFVEAK
jgi:hypothetical protein